MKYLKLFESYNFESLKDILLSIGGKKIHEVFEEDLDKLLTRGTHFVPQDIENYNLPQSRCHRNCADIWEKSKDDFQICTGWALTDDTWYQHTWLYEGNTNVIVDTTAVERSEYFGYILTDEESDDFYWDNY